MIDVARESEDRLSRKLWSFSVWISRDRVQVVLRHHAEQSRATTRHKFKSDASWDAGDERSYRSSLPRPVAVPGDVVDEAMASLPLDFHIGWATEKHRLIEGWKP